jgi:hypothetical protein
MEGYKMARPRRQVYTMDMYLKKMQGDNPDIRSDADVQRLAGQWTKEMINELVVTVLTDDYIPPIILGEEDNSQLWIIDGLQRSTSLNLFRYGNYKITKSVENSVIPYVVKKKGENGKVVLEETTFDIKNKTYEQLPVELKKKFDEYVIETAIHEHCDMDRISKLIRIYNNHVAMNPAQKSLSRIKNFAKDIRIIVGTDFFSKLDIYSENNIIKGDVERIIVETVMCTYYLDNWKKTTTSLYTYLNNNAKLEQFERDDSEFIKFLYKFDYDFRYTKKNEDGKLFDQIDNDLGTKDKSVIINKLNMLTKLLYEYLHINQEDLKDITAIELIKNCVKDDVEDEDVKLYQLMLDDYLKFDSPLYKDENLPSLLAIVSYGVENNCDKEIEDWFGDYSCRNNTYLKHQKINYLHMLNDLRLFIEKEVA